jgi:dTDP-glucose 4,6-dehydratase
MKAGALGTHNTLGVAREHRARYLLASTSEIYGDPLVHPQSEDYWGNVDPIGKRSVYDEAKRFAEALTTAYHRFHDIDTRIVRIFNTYGPRMHPDDGRVIPNFLKQALKSDPLTIYGDGSQTRSFCYVDDMVSGIHSLLLSTEHSPVNIGNPQETSILELAELVNQITGNKAGIRFMESERTTGDPSRRKPDIARARSILNWEPSVTLEEGLHKIIPYFEEVLHKK